MAATASTIILRRSSRRGVRGRELRKNAVETTGRVLLRPAKPPANSPAPRPRRDIIRRMKIPRDSLALQAVSLNFELCCTEMSAEWFRNTTWNESVERTFNEKLHRARRREQ